MKTRQLEGAHAKTASKEAAISASREDRTTPTQGPDTSSQESTARTEREEIASLKLTQDAKAEARVAELVEETTTSDLGQDDEIEHRTDSELIARGNDQRAAVIATVSETVPVARGAAADEMATQAAEVEIEASQLAAEMAEATAGQTVSTDLGAANSHGAIGGTTSVSVIGVAVANAPTLAAPDRGQRTVS